MLCGVEKGSLSCECGWVLNLQSAKSGTLIEPHEVNSALDGFFERCVPCKCFKICKPFVSDTENIVKCFIRL
jgi:hypothetical protein